MKDKLNKFFNFIILSLFIILNESHSSINPDFTPKWKIGDSWNIVIRKIHVAELGRIDGEIEAPGEPKNIHFEVIDYKEIDNEVCYIIDITYANSNYYRNSALQLHIRETDFTLKKLLEITKDLNDTSQHTDYYYDNNHDFILFPDPLCIAIPCDFPNFPATNTDEKRTIKIPSGLTVTQKVSFIDENTAKVELSTKFGTRFIKTNQIWEKGKPWWSSAKRTFTYKDYQTGKEITKVEYDPVLKGVDTLPPELTIMVSQSDLLPPNHQMVKIDITTEANDNYDRHPDVKLDTIISNEPDDAPGGGDGHTTQDIEIKEDGSIFLRAERDGKGTGRIYYITYSATDASGNKSTASATVTVPHDMGKKEKK